MKSLPFLLLVTVFGAACATEPSSAEREPLPPTVPDLTVEICNAHLPKWQAESKHTEGEMKRLAAAYEAAPSPEKEAAAAAAVDAFVSRMEKMARIEYRCAELVGGPSKGG